MSVQMQYSPEYGTLEQELARLRTHLLPEVFSPTGTYDDAVYTKVFAYKVLAHAEFEYYIEERVSRLALDSLQGFTNSSILSLPLVCLLGFSDVPPTVIPDKLTPPPSTQQSDWNDKILIANKLQRALSRFKQAIKDNHGIKEPNLLKLLLPIGFSATVFDQVWLGRVNSFGVERGDVAHRSSAANRVLRLPDPATELSNVTSILQGFQDIDQAISRIV